MKKLKPIFVISCPYDTYSGYGGRARDIAKAIIKLDKYKVFLISQKWGETPQGFCNDHEDWKWLYDYQLKQSDQTFKKPDIWMQITIPTEFKPVGNFNIGCTAGIEATSCKPEWIQGLNQMDVNFVSSEFAKEMFENTKFEQKNQQGQQVAIVELTKPIEVIFEGADLDVYKKIPAKEAKTLDLDNVKEEFAFLSVGHWMQGQIGHDRKNIGKLVNLFFETFKGKRKKPALILKTSKGVCSYTSRDKVLEDIRAIKERISGDLPNVYVLHGDLSDEEMNKLYNHPKVKAMVSLTKGEGFGRPLLEFSLSGKPVMCSGWSAPMDFLKPEYCALLPGKLENVHPSAANDWLIKEAKWFQVDDNYVKSYLKNFYEKYKTWIDKGKRQAYYAKTNFSWDKMKDLVGNKLEEIIPEIAQEVNLNLPKLNLPKLKKVK